MLKISDEVFSEAIMGTLPIKEMVTFQKLKHFYQVAIFNKACSQVNNSDYTRGVSDAFMDTLQVFMASLDRDGVLRCSIEVPKGIMDKIVEKAGTGLPGVDKLVWTPIEIKEEAKNA